MIHAFLSTSIVELRAGPCQARAEGDRVAAFSGPRWLRDLMPDFICDSGVSGQHRPRDGLAPRLEDYLRRGNEIDAMLYAKTAADVGRDVAGLRSLRDCCRRCAMLRLTSVLRG